MRSPRNHAGRGWLALAAWVLTVVASGSARADEDLESLLQQNVVTSASRMLRSHGVMSALLTPIPSASASSFNHRPSASSVGLATSAGQALATNVLMSAESV